MFTQPFHQSPAAITFAKANPTASVFECELWHVFQESIINSADPNDPKIVAGLARVYSQVQQAGISAANSARQ